MIFKLNRLKRTFRLKVFKITAYIVDNSVLLSSLLFYINIIFLKKYFSLYKIMAVSDMINYKSFSVSKHSFNYGYLNFENKEQLRLPKKLNGIGYSLIEDCTIIASSEFVFKKNVCFGQYHDLPHNLNHIKFNNFKGSLASNSRYLLCSNNKIVASHFFNVIYISGPYDFNWYHWMIEVLPKLHILNKFLDNYQNYKVIVSERVYKSNNHRKSLSLFTDLENVLTIEQGVEYRVKRLLYIESPSYSDFEMKKHLKVKIQNGNLYNGIISSYINSIKIKIKNNAISKSKYIYLYRNMNTRKFNQNQVTEVLKKHCFEIIDTSKMDFEDQVATFMNAKIIVGPTGAAWTNIIFAKKGSYGLVFRPNVIGDSSTFPNLSNLSGLSLFSQNMKTEETEWQKIMRSRKEAYVDLDLLNKNVLNIFSLIKEEKNDN